MFLLFQVMHFSFINSRHTLCTLLALCLAPAQTPFKEGRVAPASGSSADNLQLSAPSRIASAAESHLSQGHAISRDC